MRLRTSAAAGLLLLSVASLTAGCATSTSSGASSPVPATHSDCPSALAITGADSAKTLCVAVGGTVSVNLGPVTAKWTPIELAGTGLSAPAAAGQVNPPAIGAQAMTYTAKSAGTATISSTRRACPQITSGVSCHAIVAWSVTVDVK